MKTLIAALVAFAGATALIAATDKPADPSRIPVSISGGYDTDPRDHGRPVVLVAAALGVPDEVFRETFTHVTPSRNGPPTGEQARKNKEALMRGLGKYGVTNDRLDEVSNYYRYRRDHGEMWKHVPAAAYATVKDGVITGVTLTNPGAGYSSMPTFTVPGPPEVQIKATLAYGKDLPTNGSIKDLLMTTAGTSAPAPAPGTGGAAKP